MRMIRWSSPIVLAAALALLPAAAPAAVTEFGLKSGLSVATLHGSLPTFGLIENSSKLGFGGGVWLAIPLGGNFSLQPELNYVAKGTSFGSIDLTDEFGNVTGTAELLHAVGYLELPLLARVSLPTGGLVVPYVLAGPVVGVLLSQQLQFTGGISIGSDIDSYRSVDVGASLGAGLQLGRGQVRGNVEARYTLGLSPATDDLFSNDAKNGDLLVTLGMALRR